MKKGCVGYFSPWAMANDTPVAFVSFLSPFQLPQSLKLLINYTEIYIYSFNAGLTICVTTAMYRARFLSPTQN